MKRAYVLLTRSTTLISRAISACTRDEFTHASIALDARLDSLYSFARRHPAAPLPAGLVRERLDGGFFDEHRYIPCALYALELSDDAHRRLALRIDGMLARGGAPRYSLRGLVLCKMGVAEARRDRYFCSQFVGEMLEASGEVRLPKPPSLLRPQDFARLPDLKCVYKGRLSGLMHDPARMLEKIC